MSLFRFNEEHSKTYIISFFQVKGENKELYGRGIKQLYRTHLKGTLSPFLSMIFFPLWHMLYIDKGLSFSPEWNNAES